MASRIGEMRNLCRFCMCREGLTALAEVTSSATFSVDEIIQSTGIEICQELPNAICDGCYKMIQNWVTFRRTCLRNDIVFQKLIAFLLGTKQCNADTNETTNANSSDAVSSNCEAATRESTQVMKLDDTDSDDSMPSLYEEAMRDASNGYISQSYVQGIVCYIDDEEQPTAMDNGEREDEDVIYFKQAYASTVDGSYSNDVMPSLQIELLQEDLNDELTETNLLEAEETKEGNVSSLKDFKLESTDDIDSDYSLPSLYEEVVGKHKKKENADGSGKRNVVPTPKSEPRELCPLCGMLIRNVRCHINRKHNRTKKYGCPYCPKMFSGRFPQREHINTWHEKRISYTCQHCGRGFTNSNSHYYHVANSHGKSDIYECEICHRKFKSIDGYNKHLKEHSLTSYPCPHCDKLFKTALTLEKHQLRYHNSVHDLFT